MKKLNGVPFTKDEVLYIAFMAYAAGMYFICAFALLTGRPLVAHVCVAMVFVPSVAILAALKLKNRIARRKSWTPTSA